MTGVQTCALPILHVPYKGVAPAVADLLGGQVQMMSGDLSTLMPQVRAGKLRALAVGSPRRSSLFPDLPTTLEAGYPDSDYNFWVGLFVPAKTPRPIVERMRQETEKALQQPAVRERFATLGFEPMPMTLEQFGKFLHDDVAASVALVKAAKIPTQ